MISRLFPPYGVGTPLVACREGFERNGALCYPLCRAGYHGNGPACWGSCPEGYTDDGGTCRKDVHIFGKASYGRGIGSLQREDLECLPIEKRFENVASVLSHMTKMMLTDPADAGITLLRGDDVVVYRAN